MPLPARQFSAPAPSEEPPAAIHGVSVELVPTRADFTPGLLTVLALIASIRPVIQGLTSGWESVYTVVAVVSLSLVLVDIFWAIRPIGSRARLQLRGHALRVYQGGGVTDYVFEQLRSVELQEERSTRNGVRIGTHRFLTLRGPQDTTVLEHLALVGAQDWFGDFVEDLLEQVADAAQRRITAGSPLKGEGWQLDARSLKTAKLSVERARISSASRLEDGIGLWRQGEEAPFLRVPLASRNAHVLLGVLAPGARALAAQQKGPGARLCARRSDPSWTLAGVIVMGVATGLAYYCFTDRHPMPLAGGALAALALAGLLVAWFKRPFVLFIHERSVTHRKWMVGRAVTLRDEEVAQVGIGFTKQYAQQDLYVSTVTALTLVSGGGERLVFQTNRRQPDEALQAVHDRLQPRLMAWMLGRIDMGHEVPWGDLAFLGPDGLRPKQDPKPVPYAQLRLRYEEDGVQVGSATGRRIFIARYAELNTTACLRLIEMRMHLEAQAASA